MNIDQDRIVYEVRHLFEYVTHYSETAQVGSFLYCYSETPDFLAVSGDGVIRNYEGFKKISENYYESLRTQKLSTTHETYRVLDERTVLLCWSGNIDAYFKNGDVWKMQNYTLTFIVKKASGEWKIIHSHESSLPHEIIKSNKS